MELYKLFKSILDQDTAPVVVCDLEHIIVYMNPSAIERYHKDLTGASMKDCHPASANEMIDKVVAWFKESNDKGTLYRFRSICKVRQSAYRKIISRTGCDSKIP